MLAPALKPFKFSRSLWLAFRKPALSHTRGAGFTAAVVAAAVCLPAHPARTVLLTLGAVALLYFGFVLLAIAGTVLCAGKELRRKSVHLWAGAVMVGLFVATQSPAAVAALAAVMAAWAVLAPRAKDLRMLRHLSMQRNDGSQSTGELLFPMALGATAMAAGAPTAAWLAGALVLILSDSAAALVGRRWGRLRYRTLGGVKSLEGSAAFFASTLLVALAVTAAHAAVLPPPAMLLLYAAVLTAVEAAAAWGTDNLAIPMASWAAWSAFLTGPGTTG